MNPERALRRFKENPRKVLENARNGSIPDLNELANLWDHFGPTMLSMGVLDVFFHHLDSNKVPTDPKSTPTSTHDRAFLSFVGLTKVGNNIRGEDHNYADEIIKAWPGIFKWSAFLNAARVQPKKFKAEVRRSTIDVISATWYSISRARGISEVMAATKGSIEIATQLWILEDEGPLPSGIDIPSASAALDALLHEEQRDSKPTLLDRVVKTAGGDPAKVVQLAMSRLRKSLDSSAPFSVTTTIYLDLIGHLSREPMHPLRNGFLASNIITICTKNASNVVRAINTGGSSQGPGGFGGLDAMVASFAYLCNCLESTDGFTWVIQSIRAGLLMAFIDGAPLHSKLEPEDYDMILTIFRRILPKYMVYRSVILAVDGMMKKLPPDCVRKLEGTPAKAVWHTFHQIALERYLVTRQAAALKGKVTTCDNVHCQKVDNKNAFRKCSACQATFYCSKECQVAAWNEGHRAMCKMKQQERIEGKSQSISRSDLAFFHHLAIRDTRNHLPHLRRLAQDLKGPDATTDNTDLVMTVDYTHHPAKFGLFRLTEYEANQPETRGDSANTEARNDALVERARQNPGKFVLIQSRIAYGDGLQQVLTVTKGNLWADEDDGGWIEGDGSDEGEWNLDEEHRGKSLDAVDIALGRMALDGLLESWESPTRS